MLFVFIFTFFSLNVFASKPFFIKRSINYQTDFGYCAPRVAGDLSLLLVKEFEKNHSLKEVKEKILKEKLIEKYYVSSYKIDYDPLSRSLKFEYECPEPLMRVQIYKNGSEQAYTAVLGHDGKLYDSQYEELLRKEGKLSQALPLLAFPIEDLEKDLQKQIAGLVSKITPRSTS